MTNFEGALLPGEKLGEVFYSSLMTQSDKINKGQKNLSGRISEDYSIVLNTQRNGLGVVCSKHKKELSSQKCFQFDSKMSPISIMMDAGAKQTGSKMLKIKTQNSTHQELN